MANETINVGGTGSVPFDYKLAPQLEIMPRSVRANFDGTNAAAPFLACLVLLNPNGEEVGNYRTTSTIAPGGVADVTWFPGSDLDDDTGGGSSGSIESVTSPSGTITVASPVGPNTTVDLPPSGVTVGTYGDATHTAQVTVDAEGRLSAASQIGISGIAGSGLVKLFDSTLAVNALTIDTGAAALPGGHFGLLIYAYVRTARAAANDDTELRFNGDAAANYWDQQLFGANNGTTTAYNGAITGVQTEVVSSTGGANLFTSTRYDVYNYDNTVGTKAVQVFTADAQFLGANSILDFHAVTWNSLAAINQVSIASVTGSNLLAGTRLSIFGLQ